jgi:uncharacterized protein with FMN-binding domain
MSNNQPRQTSRFVRTIRKFFVSGFVVCSFVAYAFHEHFTAPAGGSSAAVPTPIALVTQAQPTAAAPARPTEPPIPAAAAQPTAPPPPRATEPPAPTVAPQPTAAPPTQAPIAQGGYKDGEYAGPVTDAYFGMVQVKAVIQAGKIADVQFLQYPNDRRTSIRINNIAMPYLITEALQAQSAEVDIISGATLTSEAFAESLQSALATAKG